MLKTPSHFPALSPRFSPSLVGTATWAIDVLSAQERQLCSDGGSLPFIGTSPMQVPHHLRPRPPTAGLHPLQASTSSTVPLSELVWLWSLGGRGREAVMKMNGFLAVTPSKRLLLALVGTPAVTASYTDGDFAWNTRMTCGHEWAVSLADTFPFLIP